MFAVCPVCREALCVSGSSLKCINGHCFDFAKDGYVNLLRSNRAGDSIGDNRSMAVSRRELLSKGYYSALSAALCEIVPSYKKSGTLLDICCGEGYYSSCLAAALPDFDISGFDISREMVRLAAKRKCRADFYVANMTDIPFADKTFDVGVHLFAPFCAPEFSRVLKDDGVLFSVVSGERHLFAYKELLYDKPYLNDEAPPEAPGFELVRKIKVCDEITLDNADDIQALLKMTPYYYHTPSAGLKKLEQLSTLTTPVEFVIFVYKKG